MQTGRSFRTETLRAQPETSSSPDTAIDSEEPAIRAVMALCNDALNNGSTDAALALYAEDGVFMPPYSQSAVGKEAVRRAYDKVFQELKSASPRRIRPRRRLPPL
jgi:ketosteroid isomerase-like protein